MESKDLSFLELTASIDIASLHPGGKKATETLLERQMLVIARALMSDPKLLMLDEPMLGLAPIIKAKFLIS